MQKPSVLMVVEDDIHIRTIISEVLESEGYIVNEASNGEEALASVSKHSPDLILLDLQMPVMSGWTFMSEIQRKGTKVPVIIVSAQVSSIDQAKKLGAVDCLGKPFEIDDLLDKVARYCKPLPPTTIRSEQ